MYKTHHIRSTFGNWDVEKVHAVVARSTFRSQKMCETSQRWTPFGKYDVEKVHAIVARSKAHFQFRIHKTHHSRTTFGNFDVQKVFVVVAQMHILKSKILKINGFGPLLEVQMSKKYMPLWREAHFQIKMLKTPGFRTNFGGSNVASLHYTTLHYSTLHYILHNYITLHYTKLPFIILHYNKLHYNTLHSTTLHSTKLQHSKLHYNILYNYTPLHYIHYTPPH